MAGMNTARLSFLVAALLSVAVAGCDRHRSVPISEPVPPAPKVVLESRLAGSWYPANPERLDQDIDRYLTDASTRPQPGVHALILPHAGYRYSGEVAAHGLRALGTRQFTRVVVMGPSHYQRLANQVSVPDATHYRTPLGEVPLDAAFIEKLLAHPEFTRMPEAHEQEHSVQIEVPLLQHVLGRFDLVPLVVGSLDLDTTRRVAGILRDLVDTDTLVVASTDFTHYGARFGYVPFTEDISANIRALDMGAWEHIRTLDGPQFRQYCEQTGATICGRNPLGVLLEMLPPEDTLTLLAYDQSGLMTGDFDNSVSYLAAEASGTWSPRPEGRLTGSEQDALLKLARHTLEFYFREGGMPRPAEVDLEPTPAMQENCGAFVTLQHRGALRGCIGDLSGRNPLYQAVMENALNAALRDPRFEPVGRDELDGLDIEISALTPMRPVDSYLDFEPGRHGIVLTKRGQRAVYLPQVATEQGWGREETLAHLSQKAGLPEDAWRSGARFEVFEAQVFGEHEE